MGVRHLVVVDDSQTNLLVMRELLEALPDTIVHTFDGSHEALTWSADHEADGFVLDFHMPSPDGLEMTRLLRADPKYHEIPIVIVTGESDLELRTRVLVAGANDFISKPVRREELRARLTTLLALQEARKLLALRVEALQESLVDSEERARHHARRLEALWRIANNPSLRGEELVWAMLSQAAAAMRPAETFCALLGRIEDGHIVCVAAAGGAGMRVPAVGTRTPVPETATVNKPEAGRTRAWDDLGRGTEPHPMGWTGVISTQLEVGETTYSLTFATVARGARSFGRDDFAYVEVIAAFLAHQLQLVALEQGLRDSEERSREHAERLEALSRIVNNPQLQGVELWLAMLRQGGASIRPGTAYRGLLGRVSGDHVVVEAITEATSTVSSTRPWSIGDSIPLGDMIAAQLFTGDVNTRSWDAAQLYALSTSTARANRLRSYIATTFTAGASTYLLGFGALDRAKKPFAAQDHAYVEVLASFFANRLQQSWQFDRIQYQQTHDVLTGLFNRSHFRSRARLTTLETGSERYALILIDVNAFRKTNEAHGHMIGDALLVEVGAALRSRGHAGEFVGRFAGDVFAVFIPHAATRAHAEARARDFAAAFAKPFSTGDRAGKEFIALAATIGLAVAPEDGPDLDAIFSRAQSALTEAKKRAPAR